MTRAPYSAGIDVFRRSGVGPTDWTFEGTIAVPRTDAWNLAVLGESLAYQITSFPGGPRIQLASREGELWSVAGELAVDEPGNTFGLLLAGDENRLVTIAGAFGQYVDLVTWVRAAGAPKSWELLQRFRVDGARYVWDLAIAGQTLAVLTYRGAGQGTRVEVFEWVPHEGWEPSQTIVGGSWEELDLAADRLALGSMWSSSAGSRGVVEVWRRDTAEWMPDATVVAPVEPDGYQGRIGYRVHFLDSGDLIAQAVPPPGCPGDPTCVPDPPQGSRLYQFARDQDWALIGSWADDPTAPEGQLGVHLASHGSYLIASANAHDPGLRIFSTIGPSPLEIPTAGPRGHIALALAVGAGGVALLLGRRRGLGAG